RLQFEDALFDRAGGDQLIDKDRLVLADAVGAVGRLVFSSRVPPRVVMDDGVGGGQIETAAAGLEADQKDRHRARLKTVDRGGAVRRGAGQFDKADPGPVELGFY